METTKSILATMFIRLLSRKRNESPAILKADDYLLFLRDTKMQVSSSVNISYNDPPSKKELQELMSRTDYWHFIQSADYHYFVSRVLFLHYIGEYSFFAAHQCVENYLKAYLKYRNHSFEYHHHLSDHLEDCRKAAPFSHLFIHSDQASVVVNRFDPFFELARYPIQISSRPEKGQYAMLFPDDIKVLDYFVLRMREILQLPPYERDILKDSNIYLVNCKRIDPDFYSDFYRGNINFGQSFD